MKTPLILSILLLISGCALNSTTYIKPNDRFILGNNPHGKVGVKLSTISTEPVQTQLFPIDAGFHSLSTVNSGKTERVAVDKNTALHIVNNSTDTVIVELKVRGDLNLSMGYRGK